MQEFILAYVEGERLKYEAAMELVKQAALSFLFSMEFGAALWAEWEKND